MAAVAEPVSDPTAQPPPRSLVPYQSKPNKFGVTRAYRLPPESGGELSHDPHKVITLKDLSNVPKSQDAPPKVVEPTPSVVVEPTSSGVVEPSGVIGPASSNVTTPTPSAVAKPTPSNVTEPTYGPFKSKSAFSLAEWYWGSTNKSLLDFQKLISILKQPDFSLQDAVSVNWRASFKALGANPDDLAHSEDGSWICDDGWTSTPISISIPFHRQMKSNKGTVSDYCIGELRHRRIISVIKEKISKLSADSRDFHYFPYRETWKPTKDSPEIELYGEMYASQAFRAAHEEVQNLPSTEANRGLERVVVALMFWSDATQLTNFGNASLWPCYMFFGNESKSRRCQPSEHLANQIAYFKKVCCIHPLRLGIS